MPKLQAAVFARLVLLLRAIRGRYLPEAGTELMSAGCPVNAIGDHCFIGAGVRVKVANRSWVR